LPCPALRCTVLYCTVLLAGDLVVMELMIRHLEPLLLAHRVNIGFYGHNHVVQRQSAVYKKKVVLKII
jgi:hypothetical protein